jgi:polyisoprenoid-binding protein YceI
MSFTKAKAPLVLDHPAVLPEGVWTIDRATSTVAFSIRNFWITTVRGEMRDFDGVLAVDADGAISIRAGASVASIDTGIRMRDHHLRSATFLDAERYPCAELRSRSVRQLDGGRLAIEAELSLHGVNRPLSLVASILPPAPVDGGELSRIRLTASGVVDRRQFGVGRSWLLNKVEGAEVTLRFEVCASMTSAGTR